MALRWPEKDPQANKDYALDWTKLLIDGETIDTSDWVVDPIDALAPLEIGLTSIIGGVCAVWLSGGTEGSTYSVKNTIETSRGLIDERTVKIKIKQQ